MVNLVEKFKRLKKKKKKKTIKSVALERTSFSKVTFILPHFEAIRILVSWLIFLNITKERKKEKKIKTRKNSGHYPTLRKGPNIPVST